MTTKELTELMKTLEQVFPVVRLVDADKTTVLDIDEDGNLKPAACCFAVWGKKCRCENCSSMRANRKHCNIDKYEILGQDAYHITSKYLDVEGTGVVLEIVSKFEDSKSVFLLEDKEKNRDIIDVLTSEYSSAYLIDLKTGELIPFTMNESTESEFGNMFRSGIKYNEAYRMYVNSLVLSEDKNMMLMAGTTGNIMRELRNKKAFNTVYRDSEGKYCEMKFVKVGNEPGVPVSVALGFAQKDEELRIKEEASKKLMRNLDIIGILASEYTSVYYIDLDTDELDTYTMNEQIESEFGNVFRAGIKYSSAFKMYVDTLVYPADKEMMLKAGSLFNILDQMKDKKTFITRYRNSEGRYCEMKFVKVGDEKFPHAVALGFSDRDDAIKEEIRLDRQRKVLTDLTEDFDCVSYLDIHTEDTDVIPYRASATLKRIIPQWEHVLNFHDRLMLLSDFLVAEDDRERFLEQTSKKNVLKMLEKDRAFYYKFDINIDGKKGIAEFKFTADRDSNGNVIGIVAGLHQLGRK